jgi:hypothetical protein
MTNYTDQVNVYREITKIAPHELKKAVSSTDFRPPQKFDLDVMKTFEELETLLLSKHKDYGPKNIADAPGGAINGLRVRMHDKMARINNLYEYMEDTGGFQPQHESIEDSFKDMANYAIIGLMVLRGQWPNE